jgi:hypothetical protein
MSGDLPLTTRFAFGPAITPEQRDFLREHGFILFSRVASPDEVAMPCDELERIAREWLEAGRTLGRRGARRRQGEMVAGCAR